MTRSQQPAHERVKRCALPQIRLISKNIRVRQSDRNGVAAVARLVLAEEITLQRGEIVLQGGILIITYSWRLQIHVEQGVMRGSIGLTEDAIPETNHHCFRGQEIAIVDDVAVLSLQVGAALAGRENFFAQWALGRAARFEDLQRRLDAIVGKK